MKTATNWILKDYLPHSTVPYCFRLFTKYPFQVKVVAPRLTKLGDYRFNTKTASHLITINEDLNPYEFLMVYLHEVAHCLTALEHGLKVKPHGLEWKQNLQTLVSPVLKHQWIPEEITQALQQYLRNPRATTCNHPQLTQVLRKYDPIDPLDDKVSLRQLPDGSTFCFRQKNYTRIGKKRTRIYCREHQTQRVYTFSQLAQVQSLS